MHRRSLLLAMTGALAGATAGGLAIRQASASAILRSTKSSTLSPRPVTQHYRPVLGAAAPAVTEAGQADYAFTRSAANLPTRHLPTRIWYPSTGSRPHPVIVFSHGLRSQPDAYAGLLAAWARAGFVVAAPTFPHTSLGAADFTADDVVNQPADVSAVLTQTLGLNTAPGPLQGRIDPTMVAAAGHSAGGITTVGAFSGRRDPRLKAGVVLSGTDYLSTPFAGPPAAMLFVQGAKDDTVAWGAAHTVYRAVPWSRAMLTVTEGGHQIVSESLTAVSASTIEFLRWSLYGDARARLTAPAGCTLEMTL